MAGRSRAEKKLARQEANAKNKELPVASAPASGKKVGRFAEPPEPIDQKMFSWSAGDIDHQFTGDWDWNLNPAETAELLALLEETSRLTWREVKDLKFHSKSRTRQRHHDQPLDSICSTAQDRLAELQLDLDRVFRLRHGNLLRVWGYLQGPVFRIVWYDRSHKVCPTE